MNARKILLIEQNSVSNSLLKSLLEEKGYSVKIISYSSEISNYIEDHIPDLLILGIDTYRRIGLQALHMIKRQFPFLPVIVMTITEMIKLGELNDFKAGENCCPVNLDHYFETLMARPN